MIVYDKAEELLYAEALLAESEEKWTEVFQNVVLSVLRTSTKNGVSYYKIMKDRDLNETSLYAMLYEEMVYKKKLKNYEGGCPLFFWMRIYVKKLLLEYRKKNETPVSDNETDNVFIGDNTEIWEVVEKSFSELWRLNPMKAYVYLLKKYYDLSSKQISEMLGLTDSNVDQIYKRAKDDMAELLLEMEGGAK